MPVQPSNIETAVQRALAERLVAAFPATTVARSLISAAPEENRLTVLPGQSPATGIEPFIGSVDGRVWRDEDFTVRVWVEVIGTELDDVEDQADAFTAGVEDIVSTNPGLDDLPGLISFGGTMARTTHPLFEVTPGFFYRWVDVEISCKARYD